MPCWGRKPRCWHWERPSGLAAARLGRTSRDEMLVVASAGAFGAVTALLGGPLIAAILVLELAVAVLAITALIRLILAVARTIRTKAEDLGRPVLTTAIAGLAVAATAIAFRALTGEPVDFVLFSGQEAAGDVLEQGQQWTLGVLLAVIVAKGIGYAISLGGGFRGGLIFPAIFLGTALAPLLENLPGDAGSGALAVIAIAAIVAAILRLPYTAAGIAVLLVGSTPETMVLASVGAVLGLTVEMALDRKTREDAPASPAAPQ